MGSESSSSESNSSKSNSNSSNSGKKDGKIETMDFIKENDNTKILRVWIVKKSICLRDFHIVGAFGIGIIGLICGNNILNPAIFISIFNNEPNIFEIKNESKNWFKHWAIILELSNGSFVNIQFGCNGFSFKEFNKTNIDGESLLYSIIDTWGEKSHPFSFCYLGNSNYEYKNLKIELEKIKNEEIKSLTDKGKVYYHLLHKNYQNFACDIEKILFGKIQVWHSFDYYLNDFYKNFFPNIDMNKLQSKYKDDLNKKK